MDLVNLVSSLYLHVLFFLLSIDFIHNHIAKSQQVVSELNVGYLLSFIDCDVSGSMGATIDMGYWHLYMI